MQLLFLETYKPFKTIILLDSKINPPAKQSKWQEIDQANFKQIVNAQK